MIYQKKYLFLIAISFLLASFFMTRFQDNPWFSGISGLFIVVFALPSYYSLLQHLGYRKGGVILVTLSVVPVLVEAIAIITGFPYGGFEYGERLGWLLFDLVPPTISFAYLPILLGSIYVASRITKNIFQFSVLASLFNLAVDLVIDPAAVHIGFWSYNMGGFFFGVPLSNFIGWIVTGCLYAGLFYFIAGEKSLPLPSGVSVSLLWILCFWVGYLLLNSLYVPGLIGVALVLYLFRLISLD